MKTKVKDLMKADPLFITADTSLQQAAAKMEQLECGVLPVGSADKLEGIITDRDIVIRAVSKGKDITSAKVADYMTEEVFFCNENDTLEQAAEAMHDHHVSRLAVLNGDREICGIITFGCILRKNENMSEIGKVVECAVGKKAA